MSSPQHVASSSFRCLFYSKPKRGPEFHQESNCTGGVFSAESLSPGPTLALGVSSRRECLSGRATLSSFLTWPCPSLFPGFFLSAPHLPSPHQSLHTCYSPDICHLLLIFMETSPYKAFSETISSTHTHAHVHLHSLLTPLLCFFQTTNQHTCSAFSVFLV